VTAIAQELSQSVGVSAACKALAIPRSRLYAQYSSPTPRSTPAHAFSAEERAAIRAVLNSDWTFAFSCTNWRKSSYQCPTPVCVEDEVC
jgi:hypothetical protein